MSNMISNIYLCHVDFTPTNQRLFKNKTVRDEYMRNHTKHTFTNCRYIPRSGSMIVKGYINDISDCNYGYYINQYQGKMQAFYFWIVGRESVSKNSTELTIQIDAIQTWFFDMDFLECMVERENVFDDLIGLHTYPEDFEVGDYYHREVETTNYFNDDVVYIIAESGERGTKIGGLYNACKFLLAFNTTAIDSYIQDKCNAGKGDAITYIFSYPKKFLSLIVNFDDIIENYGSNNLFDLTDTTYVDISKAITKDITIKQKHKDFTTPAIETNYKPFNNKLYTYPYNYITIMTPYGNNVVLKYEMFENWQEVKFRIVGTVTQNPKFLLVPIMYNGRDINMQDSIELGGFGLCSWNNDNYANWYAQNSPTIKAQSENARNSYGAQNTVNANNYNNALYNRDANASQSAISIAGSMGNIFSNPFGTITGAVTQGANAYIDYERAGVNAGNDLSNKNLLNTTSYENQMRSILASVQSASVQPNTARGDLSASGLDICTKTNDFYIAQTQIKAEYATNIDMYFQMFGYKVNEIKKPYLYNRKKWDYIKTCGCVIVDKSENFTIPQDDKNYIQEIFDNGIRFWHTETATGGAEIGKYNVYNDGYVDRRV